MKLGIVAAFFNPLKYKRITDNFNRFRDGLGSLQERLWTAALWLDGEKETIAGQVLHHYGQRPDHVLWQKECLLNAAIAALPPEYDAVAWLDADVLFPSRDWVEETEHKLASWPVVQCFSSCDHAGRLGIIERSRPSIAWLTAQGGSWSGAAWGMAWAARRSVVTNPGLLDWMVTGAGDAAMADAWLGRAEQRATISTGMRVPYLAWAEIARQRSGGRIGCVAGRLAHLWHGEQVNRRYGHRNRLLAAYGFDPCHDLLRDGPLYRWAQPHGPLPQAIEQWWAARGDDG